VEECELAIALDEHTAVQELFQRLHERGRWFVEHRRDVAEGELPPERRRDCRDTTGVVGDPVQPMAHAGAEALWYALVDQFRPACVDPYERLLTESGHELHKQVRAAAGACRHVEERVVGLGAEKVGRDLRDRGLVQGEEGQPFGAAPLQLVEGGTDLDRRRPGPDREEPSDRHGGQVHRQGPERGRRGVVRPLQVVEADDDRGLERGSFQERFDVLEQPVALLGRRVCGAERVAFEDGLGAFVQGFQERGELHDRVTGIASPACDSHRPAPGHRLHLGEQPALAHAGRPFDHESRASAREQAVQVLADRGQLAVPTSNAVLSHVARVGRSACSVIHEPARVVQIAGSPASCASPRLWGPWRNTCTACETPLAASAAASR
jgi:hypothetical protein